MHHLMFHFDGNMEAFIRVIQSVIRRLLRLPGLESTRVGVLSCHSMPRGPVTMMDSRTRGANPSNCNRLTRTGDLIERILSIFHPNGGESGAIEATLRVRGSQAPGPWSVTTSTTLAPVLRHTLVFEQRVSRRARLIISFFVWASGVSPARRALVLSHWSQQTLPVEQLSRKLAGMCRHLLVSRSIQS